MAVDNIARGMAAKALENQGGGGSSLPIVNTAAIGQTIRVSAVDDAGKPTEWEAVEFPAGGEEWELIADVYTGENDLTKFELTEDMNGEPFELKEALLFAIFRPAIQSGSAKTSYIKITFDIDTAKIITGAPVKFGACPADWTYIAYSVRGVSLPDGIHYYGGMKAYNNVLRNALGYVSGLDLEHKHLDINTGDLTDNKITCAALGGYEATIGAGSRIRLYGIRK